MKNALIITILGVILGFVTTTQIFACAMTAVVCNGTHELYESMCGLGNGYSDGESYWLKQRGSSNPDGHGMVYYHKSGLSGHSHNILEYENPIDTVTPNGNNHLYRKIGNLASNSTNLERFVINAKNKQGKLYIGHVRKRDSNSNEPTGVFAPFFYRSITTVEGVPDTTDYSFAHHGSVDKEAMLGVSGFQSWLENFDIQNILNGTPTYYSVEDSINVYVDSDYLFLWLVMYIEESANNIRNGLVVGLTALNSYYIEGNKNILFSDGDGVYAYTNEMDYNITGGKHLMSYKAVEYNSQIFSYLIRSYDNYESTWIPFVAHDLYYFPTQGQMEVTYNADISVPVSFTLKQGLNWISFPVLESTYGLDPDYTLRDVNQYANEMQTKNGTQLQEPWVYSNATYSWPSYASLSRTNGYILDIESASVYTSYGQKNAI